jgi:hypothetical protein
MTSRNRSACAVVWVRSPRHVDGGSGLVAGRVCARSVELDRSQRQERRRTVSDRGCGACRAHGCLLADQSRSGSAALADSTRRPAAVTWGAARLIERTTLPDPFRRRCRDPRRQCCESIKARATSLGTHCVYREEPPNFSDRNFRSSALARWWVKSTSGILGIVVAWPALRTRPRCASRRCAPLPCLGSMRAS